MSKELLKQIDVFQLNYNLLNYQATKKLFGTFSNNNLLVIWGLVNFFLGFAKAFVDQGTGKNNDLKSITFYYGSNNQKLSLQPLACIINNKTILGRGKFGDANLGNFDCYRYSVGFLAFLLKKYRKERPSNKKILAGHFNSYLITYGFYRQADEYLANHRGECRYLVLSNDHTMRCRVMNELARKYGIKTVYIQHASVNPAFPPLNFDYACLDGIKAAGIYSSLGKTDCRIFVTGSLKLEKSLNILRQGHPEGIAICFNPLDDLDRVYGLVDTLIAKYREKLIIRPHPNDKRYYTIHEYCDKNGISFSASKKETVFDFFSRTRYLIAGESNIHLEACAYGVLTVYFRFAEYKTHDWYGFLKDGIITHLASEAKEVLELLEKQLPYKKPPLVEEYFENLRGQAGSPLETIKKLLDEDFNPTVCNFAPVMLNSVPIYLKH